jgi:hypothetical protein
MIRRLTWEYCFIRTQSLSRYWARSWSGHQFDSQQNPGTRSHLGMSWRGNFEASLAGDQEEPENVREQFWTTVLVTRRAL